MIHHPNGRFLFAIAGSLMIFAFCLIICNPIQPASKQKFEDKYAGELDKWTRSLLQMGFGCRYVFNYTDPMCPKCCEHLNKVARLGKLDANCECVDLDPTPGQ